MTETTTSEIRQQFLAKLAERVAVTAAIAHEAHMAHFVATSEAERAGVELPEVVARRLADRAGSAKRHAESAKAMLESAQTGDLTTVLEAAETGEISVRFLDSIIPDQYGRISPFAMFAYNPEAHREYTSRNLTLVGAIQSMHEAQARGHRATVGIDACG